MTFEKLRVITIIAGFVPGRSLPLSAAQLADFIRDLCGLAESTQARAEDDLGMPLNTMDLRRYDPRRIDRDSLEDEPLESDIADTHYGRSSPATRGVPRNREDHGRLAPSAR